MKPDWKNAPEWANWLAMDRNGEWYWYENIPERLTVYWLPVPTTEKIRHAGSSNTPLDWKETLEPRIVKEVPKMGHIHAELMAEYAQDAMETHEPWERWEIGTAKGDAWHSLSGTPTWAPNFRYRRNPSKQPKKTKMWQWILKDKTDGAVSITDKYFSEMPTGNEEDDYFEIVGKAEWTEIEV